MKVLPQGEVLGLVGREQREGTGDYADVISVQHAAGTPEASEEAAAEETGVVVEGALTNKTLRDWVKRWCAGDRTGLPLISTWNTSRVTDFSWLFEGQSEFNDDISAWDTSNVTNMSWMFYRASSFNQPLNDWRGDKVTDMSRMFEGSAFDQDLSNWSLRHDCKTERMFDESFQNSRPVKKPCCAIS